MSFGLSWCAVSVVVTGWLRPNASAARPGRSTLALKVTSKLPVSVAVVWVTDDGFTVALPTVIPNGTVNLSDCHWTWCATTAWRPAWARAVTRSDAPPVAVSNAQTPARVLRFGLLPTVPRMYGAPNGVVP